jgi:hypothetical protein
MSVALLVCRSGHAFVHHSKEVTAAARHMAVRAVSSRASGDDNNVNAHNLPSSSVSSASPVKRTQLQMVPHTRSANHWNVLLHKISAKTRSDRKNPMLIETEHADRSRSKIQNTKAQEQGEDSVQSSWSNVIYLAALDCYSFGSTHKGPVDVKLAEHASAIQDEVVKKLSGKCFENVLYMPCLAVNAIQPIPVILSSPSIFHAMQCISVALLCYSMLHSMACFRFGLHYSRHGYGHVS